jgi:hypothetical protein
VTRNVHTASARRLAAAPISWGVCEVPGWGRQLAPERVLAEMVATGLGARDELVKAMAGGAELDQLTHEIEQQLQRPKDKG